MIDKLTTGGVPISLQVSHKIEAHFVADQLWKSSWKEDGTGWSSMINTGSCISLSPRQRGMNRLRRYGSAVRGDPRIESSEAEIGPLDYIILRCRGASVELVILSCHNFASFTPRSE